MPQELFECQKCKKIMEGLRYCIGCGTHHDNLKKVIVYTQEEVDKLLNSEKSLKFR